MQQSQGRNERCFEQQCGLLHGVLDQHLPKLCVPLSAPTQVAWFVSLMSPTLAFLHVPEAVQPLHVSVPLVAASFTTTTHLNWATDVKEC